MGGVMMKGKNTYSISLYNNNEVHTKSFPFKSLTQKVKFLGLPFIRGIIMLFEMLIIGYKSLSYSSEFEYTKETEDESSAFGIMMIISLIFSLFFAIFLFKLLPLSAATWIDSIFNLSSVWFNLLDGGIKLLIFISYVYFIGLLPEIKDVFRYHGAEHKTINCFESGKELNLKNVRKQSTRHLRCGTTFLLLVIVISILVYVLIPKTLPFSYNLLLRVALLPFIASISYEFQRLAARKNIWILKLFLYPGLLLQALTTKEPSIKHLRCGIASLKDVIKND